MNTLNVLTLGGVDEVGKNLTAYEYKDEILLVDCGSSFPEATMVGVSSIIPDFTYLRNNKDKIIGIIITHGHEDHIGGLPQLISEFDLKIYGTRLTLELIKNKLKDTNTYRNDCLKEYQAGDKFTVGKYFQIEFIHVTHSIVDSVALAITTPVGVVMHTGDFKVDLSPINGQKPFDLQRFAHYGAKGVLLLCSDSTNAEVPGYTPSEIVVKNSLIDIIDLRKTRRIVIASFSTNFNRLQTFVDLALMFNRKLCVFGKSMERNLKIGISLGYIKTTADLIIGQDELEEYTDDQVLIVSTGSQGEPLSALQRMIYAEKTPLELTSNDTVILSSKTIPGNEKQVGTIINGLIKMNVEVIKEPEFKTHVSGHGCQEELKLIQSIVKPKFFMPVHGEARQLVANKRLGISTGIPDENIFIPHLGSCLELTNKSAKFIDDVPAGETLVTEGLGVHDLNNIVANERKILAQEGIVVIVLNYNKRQKTIIGDPEVFCKGFVYLKGSEDLLLGICKVARTAALNSITFSDINYKTIKKNVKDFVSKYIYEKEKLTPYILPILITNY